jgi:hypothetical protein
MRARCFPLWFSLLALISTSQAARAESAAPLDTVLTKDGEVLRGKLRACTDENININVDGSDTNVPVRSVKQVIVNGGSPCGRWQPGKPVEPGAKPSAAPMSQDAAAPSGEFSASLGVGLSHELLGVDLAYRRGHIEGYAGLGIASLLPGVSFGGRWFARDDGGGFFVALNLGVHGWSRFYGLGDNPASWPATSGVLGWATVTPGYRFSWDHVYLQASIGAGLYSDHTSCPKCTSEGPKEETNAGVIPDVMLAVGLRF